MPGIHHLDNRIFTVRDFLSYEECDAYIELAEDLGFGDAPITTAHGPLIRKDIRNNDRVMLDDADRSERLWQRLVEFVPHEIRDWRITGLNERLRFYRYDVGQLFDWHYDGAFRRSPNEQSWLTFMVYLNDDFEGGETAFDTTEVWPERGMALIFVHRILHSGRPVTNGRKYVLRSDVMYRRIAE